jgi:hypothetical protein
VLRLQMKTTLAIVLALCVEIRGIPPSQMIDVSIAHMLCGKACFNPTQQVLMDLGSTSLYYITLLRIFLFCGISLLNSHMS